MSRLHNFLLQLKRNITNISIFNYDIILCELVNETVIYYKLINNEKIDFCSWEEFINIYNSVKQKYSLTELAWVKLVLETYFIILFKYFLYSLKNLLTGKTFWKLYGPTIKWYRAWLSVWYDSLFGTVIYITKYYVEYHRETFIFYHKNLLLSRKNITIRFLNKELLEHVVVFYNSLRSLVLPIVVSLIILIILVNYSVTNLVRQVGAWLVVGLIFFWLISGFNFFLKRYRFGKFTSAIQRFWKRANTYFWLVEGFLFSLFFYYYLNSSQEPLYMYDESNLNQTHLFSLINAYSSYIFLVFCIFYSYFLILNISNFNNRQQILHLTVLTLCLVYIYLIESYQFYYVLTSFIENFWVFDAQANVWSLEFEVPRVRAKHQYLLLALIAKYWHFLFIFLSWLFFAVKSFEQKRIYYGLFGVNIQNLLILFGLNILFYAQWLKWVIRRFYDISYYWFFTDPNCWSVYLSFNSILSFITSVVCNRCCLPVL